MQLLQAVGRISTVFVPTSTIFLHPPPYEAQKHTSTEESFATDTYIRTVNVHVLFFK